MAGLELFANQAQTTVSSGGTSAPAAGTSESWTVASSIGFPAASSSASPPAFFRVTDANSSTSAEKMIVTNVSGSTWTVTRGAEGTTPVAHSSGFTVQNVVTTAALEGFVQASSVSLVYPSDDTSGSGDAATVNGAVTALGSTSGTIVLAPGNWYLVPGAVTVEPGGSQAIVIDGRWGAVIHAVSGTAGDVIRMYNSSTQVGNYDGNAFSMRSGVRGLVIDGTSATAGSTGLHLGDMMNAQVDVIIQNFSGTGDIGLHLDNHVTWTEQADVRASLVNNTANVVMEVTLGAPSFAYGTYDFSIQAYPGQDGLVIKNGAFPYSSKIRMRGNFGASTSFASNAVLRVTGVAPGGSDNPGNASQAWATGFDVDVECNAGAGGGGTAGPYTIYIDSGSGCSIYACTGQMNFNGAGATFHAANATAGGDFQFFGPVLGDSTINQSTVTWPTVLEAALGIGNYATPQTLTTGATITLTGNLLPLTSAAAVTGVILTAGSGGMDGQLTVLCNTGSYPIKFAAPGTSNLAADDVVPAGQAALYIWSAETSLWYRTPQGQFTATLASSFTSASSTSPQNVTGLAATLGVGTWKVRGWFPYGGAGTAGDTKTFAFTFGGTASGSAGYVAWTEKAAAYKAPTVGAAVTTSATTATTVATVYVMEVEATVVVSVAGTLQLTVTNNTAGGDEVTIEAGARLEVTQVA